jgi:hypothetical protein
MFGLVTLNEEGEAIDDFLVVGEAIGVGRSVKEVAGDRVKVRVRADCRCLHLEFTCILVDNR